MFSTPDLRFQVGGGAWTDESWSGAVCFLFPTNVSSTNFPPPPQLADQAERGFPGSSTGVCSPVTLLAHVTLEPLGSDPSVLTAVVMGSPPVPELIP